MQHFFQILQTFHFEEAICNTGIQLGPHSSFLQKISCLQTPLLMVELLWWLISFTFRFTSSSLSWLNWEGKGFLTEKVLKNMKFCINMSNILGSCVILIQAPTKCFNVSANGTTENFVSHVAKPSFLHLTPDWIFAVLK